MDWGYNISADNQLNLDLSDKSLSQVMLKEEPSFALCMYCGTCSATCSAGEYSPMRLHRLNLAVVRGDESIIHNEIARCMGCGKCSLACPRGVNTRNVLFLLKKWSSENKLKN